MAAPSIRVEKLKKSFGGPQVLDGVDVELKAGRVNFIIGQSGGGKSVLLKHLVGLMTADGGRIWYDGLEVANAGEAVWRKLRRRLALLFQDGALFDSMSVGENVAFPLWVHGRAKARAARELARARLKELDMEAALDRRPSELSAGERKRAALARALIMEPEALFFDEPTTGLDPLLSDQVDELIQLTLARTGATLVVVSHDIPATLHLADHINMIHDGRIILSGPPDVFRQSRDPVVHQFLSGEADGPMGFLD